MTVSGVRRVVVLGLAVPAVAAGLANGILVASAAGIDAQREPAGEIERTTCAVTVSPVS